MLYSPDHQPPEVDILSAQIQLLIPMVVAPISFREIALEHREQGVNMYKNFKYNPANWYWIVAGDAARVYSSAQAAYVSVADATYLAWMEQGNITTKIDSEDSLKTVLQEQFPAGWQNGAILDELASLDSLLPRSLENFWEVTEFDTSKLNAKQLEILARKITLRGQLSN